MTSSPRPAQQPDGWATSAPEEVGLDCRRLGAAVDWLDRLPNQTLHSLLVVRRGVLAFEHYRKGTDPRDTLAAIGQYVHEQHLSPRVVAPEEIFALDVI